MIIAPRLGSVNAACTRYGRPLLRHPPHFTQHHGDGHRHCGGVGDGAGVHDAIDPHKEGEDQDQRDEKEDLAGKRDQDTALGLADGSKKIGADGLERIGEGHKEKNTEIAFRKVKIRV